MAFVNQIINPGFGIGTTFGVPTTAVVNSSSTYTISSGLWLVGINQLVAGLTVSLTDTNATATYTIAQGAGLGASQSFIVPSDGTYAKIVSTTTSVNVQLIRLE